LLLASVPSSLATAIKKSQTEKFIVDNFQPLFGHFVNLQQIRQKLTKD